MRFASLKNPIVRFLVIIFFLFLAWYLLYELWIHPAGQLDMLVIDFTITISKWILEAAGYVVFTGSERVIGVDGTGGLWIGDSCNAMALFALFAAFIIAYKGKASHKFLYILFGIISIQLLNVLRVVGLAILDTHSRAWTEFNHTYTFNIIIYAWIFILWMTWVNKYSHKGTIVKTS
ncbi:MAG: archaeosortase/exosortase family protein [Bacteroidota bacterium]|nr:archaeosortase/exosortase family protein [Bacteroidota bacterium]